MTLKKLEKKIVLRKKILNTLTLYLSPRNKFILYLSKDLDKFISMHQNFIYKKHLKKNYKCINSKKIKKIAA